MNPLFLMVFFTNNLTV